MMRCDVCGGVLAHGNHDPGSTGHPKWQRVSLPYAVFGIAVENLRVVDAAPIGRWMVGKTQMVVKDWVISRGGTVEDL